MAFTEGVFGAEKRCHPKSVSSKINKTWSFVKSLEVRLTIEEVVADENDSTYLRAVDFANLILFSFSLHNIFSDNKRGTAAIRNRVDRLCGSPGEAVFVRVALCSFSNLQQE